MKQRFGYNFTAFHDFYKSLPEIQLVYHVHTWHKESLFTLIASHLLFSFVVVVNPVSQQLEEWLNVPKGWLLIITGKKQAHTVRTGKKYCELYEIVKSRVPTWCVAENKEAPEYNIGVPPVRRYANYRTPYTLKPRHKRPLHRCIYFTKIHLKTSFKFSLVAPRIAAIAIETMNFNTAVAVRIPGAIFLQNNEFLTSRLS